MAAARRLPINTAEIKPGVVGHHTDTSVNAADDLWRPLLRDRGERYDFTARVDAGYTQNLGLKTVRRQPGPHDRSLRGA